MELKDFDRMTLQPGEVLVLRPRHVIPVAMVEAMRDCLRRNGIARCVLVPHDFDIMVVQDSQDPGEAEPSPEDLAARNTEVKAAYDAGRVIQYQRIGSDEWCDAHRVASPHLFDFDGYRYRLPARTSP